MDPIAGTKMEEVLENFIQKRRAPRLVVACKRSLQKIWDNGITNVGGIPRVKSTSERRMGKMEKNIKQIGERLIGLQCLNAEITIVISPKALFTRPILIFNCRTIRKVSSRRGIGPMLRKDVMLQMRWRPDEKSKLVTDQIFCVVFFEAKIKTQHKL